MSCVNLSRFALSATLALIFLTVPASATGYVFGVRGDSTTINGKGFVAKGLRCSQSLVCQWATDSLIFYLDTFKYYGCNTISVFIMGSRYGNIPGFNCDGTLNPVYSTRLGQIIEAADSKGMIIQVGCLYWGGTNAKCSNWGQAQVDTAIANTARWLSAHNYRNTFMDPDNEAMAGGIIPNKVEVISTVRAVDPAIIVANPWNDQAAFAAADLAVHVGYHNNTKPYIESEGCGSWSYGSDNYTASAIGTQHGGCSSSSMAAQGPNGFLLADMWLQADTAGGLGPNMNPGTASVGIRTQLEALKTAWGSWNPPQPLTSMALVPRLSIKGNTGLDEVRVFDVRGKLMDRFKFSAATPAGLIPRSINTGIYILVHERNGQIIDAVRMCKFDR